MNSDRAPVERPIRVLVADSSRIHTRLLAQALTRDSGLEVIPFEADPAELVESVVANGANILVVSSNLNEQDGRGLEVLRELRTLRPSTRAVLLPDSSKDDVILQAFRAGVRGVFGRNEPIELLSKCVRCVHEGEIWANNHYLNVALGALANVPAVRVVNADGMNLLSERELQVVRCLSEGLTNREIAQRMKLSQHTVKNYLFRVFDKLGVSNRVELLSMALSHYAEPPPTPPANEQVHDAAFSQHEYAVIKKSAEAGLPAAQLALAQLYLTRREGPEDLINAYTWFLIATERALQARELVTRTMTPQQMYEAERRASLWLSKRNQAASGFGARWEQEKLADSKAGGFSQSRK